MILDEIGECERAAISLKYFAEKTPTYLVAASGSKVGLLNTFPVGKVEQYDLCPMTYREFLYASEESTLIKAFEAQADSAVAHARLLDSLTDYYFTGGMPEAVQPGIDTKAPVSWKVWKKFVQFMRTCWRVIAEILASIPEKSMHF